MWGEKTRRWRNPHEVREKVERPGEMRESTEAGIPQLLASLVTILFALLCCNMWWANDLSDLQQEGVDISLSTHAMKRKVSSALSNCPLFQRLLNAKITNGENQTPLVSCFQTNKR